MLQMLLVNLAGVSFFNLFSVRFPFVFACGLAINFAKDVRIRFVSLSFGFAKASHRVRAQTMHALAHYDSNVILEIVLISLWFHIWFANAFMFDLALVSHRFRICKLKQHRKS